ncbi:MAG TPA: tyrosine--tRNA ligase [bacterium]|nr:tyrosine--tRNA ligase [bacterium]
MKSNVFQILKERGFIYQTTDDKALEKLLVTKSITAYIGFDATADSLHVGSLVPIMGLVHLQQAGHRPIALLGGGTTMVGDPSGKTEMRRMLTLEEIEAYGQAIKSQLSRFLSFDEGRALMLNNAEWLLPLNYIEFLRDVGRHFSVNRMLTAESIKQRLDKGLSFIEFNYMLLQAYDFYVLARDYDCEIQMGGQDQWGNIVAGSDLTRRMMGKQVYGITFPLLMSAAGEKFGKTAAGAVWLDKAKTPVFDFYQFWRNVDDQDVKKCLGLFTWLPSDEIEQLVSQNINRAKEILAFEVTRAVHGEDEAVRVYTAAIQQFGASDPKGRVQTSSRAGRIRFDMDVDIPTIFLPLKDLESGIWIVRLFVEAGLCRTNGEARRLIGQGGGYLDDEPVVNADMEITPEQVPNRELILKAGKKRMRKIRFQ